MATMIEDTGRTVTLTFILVCSAPPDRIITFQFGRKPSFTRKTFEQQAWVIGAIKQLCLNYPNCPLAFVSHVDVIKSALPNHLGLLTNAHDRVEMPAAPISTLVVEHRASKFFCLNEVVAA